MRDVNIAVATNSKFTKYTAVAIKSMLLHISAKNFYRIYVLEQQLTNREKRMLEELAKLYENVSMTFIDPSKLIEDYSFYVLGHFSKETYYRLVLPELLNNVDKILYLDSDVIVKEDLSRIFDIEIGDNLVGASFDADTAGLYNGYKPDKKEYMDNILKLQNPYSYFQAGVLLMNLVAFREKYTTKEILDYSASQKFQLLDQDILNKLCENRVHYIDMKWNVMVDFAGIRQSQIIALAPDNLRIMYHESRQEPFIIHYAGPEKPWYYPAMDMADEFWKIARTMPFYEELLWEMSQHAADEIYRWHATQIKHPVKEMIDAFRKATFKIWPEKSRSRIAFKSFVKKIVLKKQEDDTRAVTQWVPSIPEVYRNEL